MNLPTYSNTNQPLTMSSREIAEYTGKQHQHVKRDIEAMLNDLELDVSKFGRIYKDQMNRNQTEYLLDRDYTDCLLTGYSAKARMSVIKRWKELESKQLQPAPQLPDLSRTYAAMNSEVKAQEEKLKQEEAEISRKKKALYYLGQYLELENGTTQIPSKSQAQRERDHILAYVARREPMTVDQLEQNVVRQQGNPFEIYTKRGEARSMIRHTIGDLCQIGYVKLSGDHIIPICH